MEDIRARHRLRNLAASYASDLTVERSNSLRSNSPNGRSVFGSIAEHEMAKITPMDLVKSMSGKICEHSDISFAKRGGTQYTMKRCNNRDLKTNPYTPEELAHQAKFKAVAASTAARVKTAAPEDMDAFKAQKKYKSFRSYIWALEWAAYTA